MQKLEPPDTHYFSAALGWLELGNLVEAKVELGHIATAQQNHPDVLELRWMLCAEQKDWESGLSVARDLLHRAPERSSGWLHQAYALRRAPGGGIEKAWEALLPAFDKFPKEYLIAYNLSCYACQLRQLDDARHWFGKAVALGDKEKIRRMALADSDLEPLWDEIRKF